MGSPRPGEIQCLRDDLCALGRLIPWVSRRSGGVGPTTASEAWSRVTVRCFLIRWVWGYSWYGDPIPYRDARTWLQNPVLQSERDPDLMKPAVQVLSPLSLASP